jgi:hypothetical protein
MVSLSQPPVDNPTSRSGFVRMSGFNASLEGATREDNGLGQSGYRGFNTRLHWTDKAARCTAEHCATAECMFTTYGDG